MAKMNEAVKQARSQTQVGSVCAQISVGPGLAKPLEMISGKSNQIYSSIRTCGHLHIVHIKIRMSSKYIRTRKHYIKIITAVTLRSNTMSPTYT